MGAEGRGEEVCGVVVEGHIDGEGKVGFVRLTVEGDQRPMEGEGSTGAGSMMERQQDGEHVAGGG